VGASKGTTRIHAVKVLGFTGSGTFSGLQAGVNWVIDAVNADPTLRPAVVSMSLGFGSAVPEADALIANLAAAGIATVVAAGNSGVDACTSSPGRAPQAINVGAIDSSNSRASWSNFGACVDIFAPGVSIRSSVNSTNAYSYYSGTSMAAPHVAGVVALMLSQKPCLTPANLASLLVSTAATGVVTNAGTNSPNLLVNARAAVAAAAAFVC
jgi:subtilisin family serine protease